MSSFYKRDNNPYLLTLKTLKAIYLWEYLNLRGKEYILTDLAFARRFPLLYSRLNTRRMETEQRQLQQEEQKCQLYELSSSISQGDLQTVGSSMGV